jgi:carbamoyl-phosphate synthase L subunit-like protein
MSLLIVHRNPFEPFPYARWLAGYDGPVVAVAHRHRIESVGEDVPTDNLDLTHLEIMDRFDDELVIKRSLELATEYETTRIIAHHEADVQSAAWLREHLGLPGAWTADVLPFRDKALMKKLVSAAGVEVAAHVLPATAEQARAFVAEHGFPVVFKDRAGYNAIGLRILRDEAALADHLAHVYADGPREDVLLERFVPGRMCHVDGLVSGGRTVLAWPSQYQYDLASFGTDPGARIDLTLDPDDPLTDRLLRMTDQILAALKPAGSRLTDHGFHAEIFHTPDDRLVLCEIACRPAGAKLREVFQTMFGINLGDYTTRAQAGLPMPALADTLAGGPPPRPRRMSGQLLMMKRPGLVRSVPTTPEEPWVEHFWVYARPGQVIPPAAGSSDFLTCVVGSAPTRAECHARLRELGDRFVAQVEIVEES